MSTLNVSLSRNKKFTVITISGTLDVKTAPGFHKKLKDEIAGNPGIFVINMKNLEYIASAGLGVLINANDLLNRSKGELRLCCMNTKVKDIMKLLGFLDLFKTYDDEKTALG